MKKLLLLLAVIVPAFLGAKAPSVQITPQPREIKLGNGTFKVKGAGFNYESSLEERTVKAIAALADDISAATGKVSSLAIAAGVGSSAAASSLKGVYFLEDKAVPAENYRIEISRKGVKVTASEHNGFFYAVQTLRQLLPAGVYKGVAGGKWKLPCGVISDGPRFGYRGILLDACRHFWSIDETKKFIDIMAIYKLNRLHWHLTEDQGWRLEVKKYPELVEKGAFRSGTQIGYDRESSDGVRYGGYYTQEQIKDIVSYAWERGITVVPELDLPGHMLGALATYPQLGCTGGPYEVWTRWGVSKDVLCVGKEETFAFLEGVLDEVCELFPSEYIHIGGDECPKARWETCPLCQARADELGLVSDDKGTREQKLQNYVTARIQAYLQGKGRKVIGWDEILDGDLAPGATIMSWRGTKGGEKAAANGFDVIMSPNTYCYLDYSQSLDFKSEPLGITRKASRALPLEKAYGYEPYDGLPAEATGHILGVQGNLWTEYIATPEHLEYMLLPRMLAIAEVQWCPADAKDFARFHSALVEHQQKVFEILGYNFRKE
ncbi:MAG: beta-N-acetylhexosaminidase [Bacteroidales bacterium]|nr:beta-N-acetylhexosaminidase [Bacteroidales bacterium]